VFGLKYIIDVMREPKVCKPELKILDAAKLMKKERIGSIIVIDEKNAIIGLITERDLVYRILAEGLDPNKLTVKDVMTTKITTLKPYATIIDAIKTMKEHNIKRIPITRNNKIVGIITEREITNAILKEKEDTDKLEILKDLLM
jgi:CBS domain-containing protein